MGLYSFFLINFLYPFGEKLVGTSILNSYKWLLKTQWLSRRDLEILQLKLLRKLVRHAYNNVPFYRRLFDKAGVTPDDIRDISDLKKVPLVSREYVIRHREDFIALNRDSFKAFQFSTGGSTGEPLRYPLDRRAYSLGWAAIYRGLSWGGYNIGDPVLVIAGASLVSEDKPLLAKLRYKLEREYVLPGTDLTISNMEQAYRLLIRKKIRFIRGYPSAISAFAEYLLNHGLTVESIRSIFTTAETLLPHYKKVIMKAFPQAEIYDGWGAFDGGGNAMECSEHTGLHFSMELAVLEIIDDNGDEVSENEEGTVVLTSLHNYSFPFIRYVVGDKAIKGDECPCGRGLPIIKRILGRTTELIRLPQKVISGPALTLIMKDFNLLRYQFIVERGYTIIVKYMPASGFSLEEELELKSILKKVFEGAHKVVFDRVSSHEDFIYTKSGKLLIIIDRTKRR